MNAFDSAWTLLKLLPSEEKKFGQGYGDFSDMTDDEDEPNIYRDLQALRDLNKDVQVDPDGIDGPITQEEMDDYRKVMDAPPPRRTPQMDDDPFRMQRPDMSAQIEQILAEMARRSGRKDAVQEDKMNEKDPGLHGLDEHLRQNYFKNLFDRENPQDNQLMSFTRPEMDSRMEALRAEMARRARKSKKYMTSKKTFDEENPPLDPSTEEYERAFDKKHADMLPEFEPLPESARVEGFPTSFGAPEGMTNEEYGIIDQPDSKYTKELQGQALQDYIKQRFG